MARRRQRPTSAFRISIFGALPCARAVKTFSQGRPKAFTDSSSSPSTTSASLSLLPLQRLLSNRRLLHESAVPTGTFYRSLAARTMVSAVTTRSRSVEVSAAYTDCARIGSIKVHERRRGCSSSSSNSIAVTRASHRVAVCCIHHRSAPGA